MTLSISDAQAWIATAPLVTPFRIATGQHDQLENVFLQVRTSDGICGYGEAAVATHITGETVPQTVTNLQQVACQLKGQNVADTFAAIEHFRPAFAGNHAALAAFEMALLDAEARSRGISFGDMFQPAFGCQPTHRLTSDITIVIGSLEEAQQAARQYAGQGFNAFKIKIGRDFDLDLQRVLAVKQIAPDCSLILDANMGFDADAMLRFVHALQAQGVKPELLEQPVTEYDWDGLAAVTRAMEGTGTLVCADESVGSLESARKAIELKAISAINIKFMKSGITEAVQIADLACRSGIRLMLGAMMESTVAITAAAHFAASLGCFSFIDLDTTFFIKGPLSQSPYLDNGGHFDLSNPLAGIGVEPPLT